MGGKYRPDIDGLRAIAVASVILFHLKTKFFQGGYVGVDVFFVISGYLITRIIYQEIQGDGFSIARFYERRMRRIFPALFVVLAVFSIIAWFMLLPSELTAFAKSLIATTLFVSNNFFLTQSNYFAAAAGESRLLLHTWSLAVEEQFYLVFPVFLLVLHKVFRRRLVSIVWIVALASFALSVWLLTINPTAAFYLAPTRAWELLAGGLIALEAFPIITNAAVRNALGILGLAMIGAAVFGYRPDTAFPGAAALAPVIGAALIIYSGSGTPTVAARMLGLPVVVFVGLISYSLYLWHWPIIVLMVLGHGHSLGNSDRVVALGLCLLAATASWYFVEQPFRKRSLVPWPRLLRLSLAGSALTCGVGLAVIGTGGIPGRFSERANAYAAYMNYDPASAYRQGSCFLLSGSAAALDAQRCLSSAAHRKNELLIGDSHAAHLWYGLEKAFPEMHFQQATAVGCKPLLEPSLPASCTAMLGDSLPLALTKLRPDGVILSAEWVPEDIQPLERTIRELRALHEAVYVFGPSEQYASSLPRLLAMNFGASPVVAAAGEGTPRDNDGIFAAAVQSSGGTYISIYQALCGAGSCAETTRDAVPLFFDTSHFTSAGSLFLAERLRAGGAFGGLVPGAP